MVRKTRALLGNTGIATKVVAAFTLVFIIASITSIASVWSSSRMHAHIQQSMTDEMPTLIVLGEMQQQVTQVENDMLLTQIGGINQFLRPTSSDIQATLDILGHDYMQLDREVTDVQARHLLATFHTIDLEWRSSLMDIELAVRSSDWQRFNDIVGNGWTLQTLQLKNLITNILAIQQRLYNNQATQLNDIYTTLKIVLIMSLIALLLVTGTVTVLVHRHITRPLRSLATEVHRVGEGNFNDFDAVAICGERNDEIGKLGQSLQTMFEGMRQLFERVHSTNTQVVALSETLGEQGIAIDLAKPTDIDQAQAALEVVETLSTKLGLAYQEMAQMHSDLSIAHERIQRQALTDPLTGLPNHRALMEQLEREVDRAQRYANTFSVLFFDGDRFKRVNDTYGHAVGDAVLHELGQRVHYQLRDCDLVGRYGGEEFIVVLPETDNLEACSVAERIRVAVAREPLVTDHVEGGIPVTISIGIATFPDDASELQQLLIMADQAMYWAKRLGRNQARTVTDIEAANSVLSPTIMDTLDERTAEPSGMEHMLATWKAERISMLTTLVWLVQLHDQQTGLHLHEVSDLAIRIARAMNVSQDVLMRVAMTGLLHDIGKIGISTDILNKPEELNDAERQLLQHTPSISVQVLQDSPFLREIMPGIRHHHERWDGNGYPDRLAGTDIPLESRIVAVADAFHAMIRDDAWRGKMSISNALQELRDNAGTQFDPAVVAIAVTVIQESYRHNKEEAA